MGTSAWGFECHFFSVLSRGSEGDVRLYRRRDDFSVRCNSIMYVIAKEEAFWSEHRTRE